MDGTKETISTSKVKEIILKEVPDWDDELLAGARFKDFSGQRSDWFPKYTFWRDLIVSIASQLNLVAITPSEVPPNLSQSFLPNRFPQISGKNYLVQPPGPLTNVHRSSTGVVAREEDTLHPTASPLATLVSMMKQLFSKPALNNGRLIVIPLVSLRADRVLESLSRRGNSYCVVSMNTFQSICGGALEAAAVYNRLRKMGKAQYMVLQKKESIQGVKVWFSNLSTALTALDYDVLHLTHTSEELSKQLAVIDERYGIAKESALRALRCGAKNVALIHAREMKIMSESRMQRVGCMNRVDDVLDAIYECETTNMVSEAVRIGVEAVKNEAVNGEEVARLLVEIEETIACQKEIGEALGSPYVDVQMELRELEKEAGEDEDQDQGEEESDQVVGAMAKMDLQSSPPENDEKPNTSVLTLIADNV